MPQSARGLWPPGLLRHSPVNAFAQIAEVRGGDRHAAAIGRRRPDEAATFQTLGIKAHALSVMPQFLNQPATASPEYEQMPAVRVMLERLLHQQRQTIEALAHVGLAGR